VRRAQATARGCGLAALLLAAVCAHGATAWVTDIGHSRLEFTGTLSGGKFDGRFTTFAPDIVFDPADLAGSHFLVQIQTASADTADKDRDEILKGVDFFAAGRWPAARFEAARFVTVGDGRYEARGRLTIRDVTRDVALPFSFKPSADGRTATMSGSTSIRRLDFGVGQGEWRDTQWVGDEVAIRFNLLLQRK